MKKNLFTLALVSLLTVSSAFAKNESISEANEITLKNNDTVNVSMSLNQINRIYVNHDIISNVNCPSNFCEITSNKNDPNGSLYIKYRTDKPFTYFISTNDGYHFGVRVTPKETKIGNTVAFTLLGGNTKQAESENSSDYSQLIIKRMTNMVKEQQVDGWNRGAIESTKQNSMTVDGIKVSPLYVYHGAKLSGYVSLLTNTTHHVASLNESEFYVTSNRAIAINKDTLKPNETALLYVLK